MAGQISDRSSTIESLQSEEYDIVIASLVTIKGLPMPMGNLYRANVANVTAEYWFTRQNNSSMYLHKMLRYMQYAASRCFKQFLFPMFLASVALDLSCSVLHEATAFSSA